MSFQQLPRSIALAPSNASIYNINDFAGNNITPQLVQIDVNNNMDTSNFIQKSGDFVDGTLILRGNAKIVFADNKEQFTAFDEGNIAQIEEIKGKTDVLTKVDDNTLSINSLTINNNISIPNNSLSVSKINTLSSSLSTINSGISTINGTLSQHGDAIDTNTSNITSIQNTISQHGDSINTNTSNITTIQNTLSNHGDAIDTNTSNITTINNALSQHGDSIDTNTSNIATIQDTLSNHTSSISTHSNDISSINSTIISHNTDIAALQQEIIDIQNVDLATEVVETLNQQMDTITSSMTTLQNSVNNNATTISNHSTAISSISSDVATLLDDVGTISNTVDNHGTTLTQHGITILSHTNSITSIQSTNTNLQTQINAKQAIIDANNRIDINYIGNGSLTNDDIETLVGIDTSQTIQHQLNTIKTSVQSLTGLQDIDIDSIQQIQSNITDISAVLSSLTNEETGQPSINTNVQNQLDSHNTSIEGIQTELLTIGENINTHGVSITNLENNTQTLINTNNLLSSSLVSLNNDTVENVVNSYIASNNSSISSLQSGKQNVINSGNKLNSNVVSLNGDTVNNVINNYISSNDTAVASLQTGKQDTISSENLLSASLISLNEDTIDNVVNDYISSTDTAISSINQSITTLQSSKQNTIDNLHKLSYANIDLGESSLSFVDISSSLQDSLNDISNTIDGHTTAINSHTGNISSLQSADIVHTGLIEGLRSDVDDLTSNKQNNINETNLISSDYISTAAEETLTDKLTSLSSDIQNLDTAIDTKQNIIDTNNKLSSSVVDYSSSALRFVDISANLQSQLTTINGAISTLQNLQNGDITTFQTIEDNFTSLETSISAKQDTITSSNRINANLIGTGEVSTTKFNYLKNVSADIQNQIDALVSNDLQPYSSISYSNENTETTIIDITKLTTLKFAGDNSVQTTAFTSAKNSALSSATSDITTIQGDIQTIQGDISTIQGDISNINTSVAGKQSIIDTNSKLLSSLVDYSASPLRYVDSGITQNISTSLTSINNSLTSLSSANISQADTNTQFTSDISDLYSTKQNTINSGNKLSSLYVSYGLTTVSGELDTILGDIADLDTADGQNVKLTGDQTIGGNKTFSGTISGISKTMIGLGNCDNTSDANKPVSTAQQTALNLKANLTNPSFVGLSNSTTAITSSANIECSGSAKFKMTSGAANGYVLTSDADGLASWASASGGGGGSGLTTTLLTSSDISSSGVYSVADNTTAILTKSASVNNNTYATWNLGAPSSQNGYWYRCIEDGNGFIYAGLGEPWMITSDSCRIEGNTGNALVKYEIATGKMSFVDGSPIMIAASGIYDLLITGGYLYVCGIFAYFLSGTTQTPCSNIAKMNLTTGVWSAIGSGLNGSGAKMLLLNGSIFVVGNFTQANGNTSTRIASFTVSGETWTYYSTGANANIADIAAVDNSAVYICGTFTSCNSVANTSGMAKLTLSNSTYSSIGTVSSGNPNAIVNINNTALMFLGNHAMSGLKTGITKYTISGGTWSSPAVGFASTVVIYMACLRGDIIYMNGTRTYLGLDNNTNVRGTILLYNITNDTWSCVRGSDSTLTSTFLSYVDANGNIYSGSTNGVRPVQIITKDFIKIYYNNRWLRTLFFNDSALVNCINTGGHKYCSSMYMLGYKD